MGRLSVAHSELFKLQCSLSLQSPLCIRKTQTVYMEYFQPAYSTLRLWLQNTLRLHVEHFTCVCRTHSSLCHGVNEDNSIVKILFLHLPAGWVGTFKHRRMAFPPGYPSYQRGWEKATGTLTQHLATPKMHGFFLSHTHLIFFLIFCK